jgi:pimeloyl-ACP methyl ester carboxylesterase
LEGFIVLFGPKHFQLFSMKDTYIPINNHQIFTRFYSEIYDENQPTIVFLHEALGSVAHWRDFPKKVAGITGFNAFAFDRLGHGLSDPVENKRDMDYFHREAWETTPSVLAHFGIKNPILFGHSDGGSIALLYASRFSTKALITEAAHIFFENAITHGIEQAFQRKDFLIERLTRYHGEKTTNLFYAWTDTWSSEPYKNWTIEALLKDISCPALIIQGENDEYGTVEQVQRIVQGIGENAKALMIPNCGHTPHKDVEKLILNEIYKMLVASDLSEPV